MDGKGWSFVKKWQLVLLDVVFSLGKSWWGKKKEEAKVKAEKAAENGGENEENVV